MPSRERIGLVLGGGGVLGGAWMAGALSALGERLGRSLADIDVIVGTSAGSLLAAQVRCGMTTNELLEVEHRPDVLPGRAELDEALSHAPFALYPGFGSPRMLASAAILPHRTRPLAALTALMPRGRRSLDPLARMITALVALSVERGEPMVDGWPARDTWIVATDYELGRRVVFGQRPSPRVQLSDAVLASCSVPGWFSPTRIDGHTYIDGGVCSTTSLDLLRDKRLDHIYVLAPLASLLYDTPNRIVERIERRVRRWITRQLIREVRVLRHAGTTMTLLMPGPDDLVAIGPNVMDPRRRALVADTSVDTCRASLSVAGRSGHMETPWSS